MIHNLTIKQKKAITLVELIVAMLIMAFIAIYVWRVYFNSTESMRYTVSQSQIQSDIRIFLDKLETEMMTCYSFDKVDTEKKMFSFYSFTYAKMSLDEILYDTSGNPLSTASDSDSRIKVLKMEYSWSEEDGKVTKKRTPGWLYFLHRPPEFQADPTSNAFDDSEKALEDDVLKEISEFEVKGYSQVPDYQSDTGVKITPVTPDTATSTTFIVLRLHAFKEEGGKKRDEDIDIVTKFYSSIRLADAANPGYFCTTDNDGRY